MKQAAYPLPKAGAHAIRVVIYGVHSEDWMAALAPDAPVWTGLPDVKEVSVVPDAPDARIPPPGDGSLRTVIIPLMEPHIRRCPRDHASLIADTATVDILACKAAFADHMQASHILHLCPTTFRTASDIRFPCVLKRRNLNAGSGVAVISDQTQLDMFLQQAPWRGHEVTLQELVPGDTERVTHCVCKNGHILWHASFAYEMGSPSMIRGPGNVRSVRPVPTSAAALSAFEKILRPLAYSGPCNIDYKVVDHDRIVVFEVNPRLGGSMMLPANLGYLTEMLACILRNAVPGDAGASRRHAVDWLRDRVRRAAMWLSRVWAVKGLRSTIP